jgi:hypothetical protein
MSPYVQDLTQKFKDVVMVSDTQVSMVNSAFLHRSGFDGRRYYVSVNGSLDSTALFPDGGSQKLFLEEWMVSLEDDPDHPLQDMGVARRVLDSFFLTHWNILSDELKEDSECLFTRKLLITCKKGKCALARRSRDYFPTQKKKCRER